jgi:ribonuclease Y
MESAYVIVAAVLGVFAGVVVSRKLAKGPQRETIVAEAEAEAQKLRDAALSELDEIKRSADVESKQTAQRLRRELDEELKQRRTELASREESIARRERDLEQVRRDTEKRSAELEKKERSADGRFKQAEAEVRKAESAHQEARQRLEEASHLSEAEARRLLEDQLRAQAQASVSREIKQLEDQAEQEATLRANTIIAAAIQRFASEFVHERTVSVVPLPSDDLKGRLIGREGRNIRALEAATGIDLIIDDTPEAITISCFNPVRREIARLAIGALVADGRIHPTRIEEVVRKAEKDVEKVCKEAGEQAVFDLGIHRVHPELVKHIGRLRFCQAQAHNVLHHSVEVGFLAGLMAAELGQNEKLARRAGLLHDIGKSVDHEHEGNHADVGSQLARKFGESPKVCQAIASHHKLDGAASILDHLVAAANTLSEARPGARREQLASYIRRLEDLETICRRFAGVERAFALQAGREVRVMVLNDRLDDAQALMLSKDIARSIENEASYPGQVRVVVVRETRASDYAR